MILLSVSFTKLVAFANLYNFSATTNGRGNTVCVISIQVHRHELMWKVDKRKTK